jgi:hypothetical protein
VAFVRNQRRAGIKTHVRLAGHQRVGAEARVLQRVRHHHHLRLQNRVAAEGDVARRLPIINPDFGFKPLAILVHQANQCDRNPAD